MISQIGCTHCGNKIFDYLRDQDCGDWEEEVYECRNCKRIIYVELPD